ncbi:MAG: helix-turn-helix domain-containing protein, partial [Coriobacteriales bacterium]|nr:helix-turn-helix domain-containing protein [Coriobacteriales bacterium]
IADRLRITDRVLMYDDFLVTHMFLRFGEVFDLHDLVTPSVKLLKRQDDQKGSNLTETLFAYIHHRQDVTETSKAMHIHYNTAKYRINRIREITGIDLNDEQQIFRTILSERAIALLNRMSDCDSGSGSR